MGRRPLRAPMVHMKFHFPRFGSSRPRSGSRGRSRSRSSSHRGVSVPQPTELPRNTGTSPRSSKADFNMSGPSHTYDVELVKSGLQGSAFLPVKVTLGSDGVVIKMREGDRMIRSFNWDHLFGWVATEHGFKLQTDRVGTYLEMRASNGKEIANMCNKCARQKLSRLVYRDGGASLPAPVAKTRTEPNLPVARQQQSPSPLERQKTTGLRDETVREAKFFQDRRSYLHLAVVTGAGP